MLSRGVNRVQSLTIPAQCDVSSPVSSIKTRHAWLMSILLCIIAGRIANIGAQVAVSPWQLTIFLDSWISWWTTGLVNTPRSRMRFFESSCRRVFLVVWQSRASSRSYCVAVLVPSYFLVDAVEIAFYSLRRLGRWSLSASNNPQSLTARARDSIFARCQRLDVSVDCLCATVICELLLPIIAERVNRALISCITTYCNVNNKDKYLENGIKCGREYSGREYLRSSSSIINSSS